MKTILVPTDFSKNADNALQYALEVALITHAQILLLHISPVPYNFDSKVNEITEIMEQYSRKSLNDCILEIRKNSRYNTVAIRAISKTNKIYAAVLEVSKEEKAALIVTGTKGSNGLGQYFFGSNTAEIVKRAPLPVLVVPHEAAYKDFNKMIYTVDYKNDNLSFLHEVENFAEQLGLKIETLHIAAKNSLYEQIMHQGLVQLMSNNFSNIFGDHHLVINNSVVEGVEDYLNLNPDSLLTMAHYQKPFLHRLLSTSVTQEMTYHTKTPLLIFNQTY